MIGGVEVLSKGNAVRLARGGESVVASLVMYCARDGSCDVWFTN